MNKVYISFLTALLSVSCLNDLCETGGDGVRCDEEKYPIIVEVDLPHVAAGPKSTFTDEDLNRITDLNIFVYHSGELLEEYSGYFTDMSSLMLAFPPDRDGFNIYMLGNVGKVQAPDDESDIGELCCLESSYDDFRANGFPVAEVFPDHIKGTRAVFRLKRLVGQYDIKMRPSAENAEYVVKDVRFMNCALDVYPFGYNKKAVHFTESVPYGGAAGGDMLTEDDIERLNRGETVSLYFIENLQGELLPGNTDRRKKIPSSLDAVEKGLRDCCTYIEITADITTPAAVYTDGKFRFYPGENETTDFSIKRNSLYAVTLDFTQNMVDEQEWRIEVGAPVVKSFGLSKEDVHIIRGVSDYILIGGPKVRVNFQESDLDDDRLCTCHLADVLVDGSECQKLTFSTEKEIVGMHEWRSDYELYSQTCEVVLETVETYNGVPLLSKKVKAHIYDMVVPLLIRVAATGSSAPYRIEAITPAPFDVGLELSASVEADVDVSGSGETYIYMSAQSFMTPSPEGFRSCVAHLPSLYDVPGESDGKLVSFRKMDVALSGVCDERCSAQQMYMGDGGEAYWGPGSAMFPQKFKDLAEGDEISFATAHGCSVSGCVVYEVMSGSVTLFRMAPKSRTCSSLYTTGTSNYLVWDISAYNSEDYLPFYIINGALDYTAPVTLRSDSPKYLDDSGRVSIIYEMNGPGRDVFYPNGVSWGAEANGRPSERHKFGYTAGLVKQFLGNVHTWQIYQGYDCDFYMTVNGCTAWPGSSKLSSGFVLPYDL